VAFTARWLDGFTLQVAILAFSHLQTLKGKPKKYLNHVTYWVSWPYNVASDRIRLKQKNGTRLKISV